ncbi:MAG: hypothetical protein CMK59_14250 [Proteobacteria bacterium]|nr:hypothetical protein [Pseudomonadota bacterium]
MNGNSHWIAESLTRSSGIGLIEDGDFETLEEQSSVVFSQKELLRERLVFLDGFVELRSAGKVRRMSIHFMDDGMCHLTTSLEKAEQSEDFKTYDHVLFLDDKGTLHREQLSVTEGQYYDEEIWQYRPCHLWYDASGIEEPDLNKLLSDKMVEISDKLDELVLDQMTLSSAELLVLLERPELEGLKHLSLSQARSDGELESVLNQAWHVQHLRHLNISGTSLSQIQLPPNLGLLFALNSGLMEITGCPQDLKGLMASKNPQLSHLGEVDVGNLVYLDIAHTDVEILELPSELKVLGMDRLRNPLVALRELKCLNISRPIDELEQKKIPLEQLECVSLSGSIDLERLENVRLLELKDYVSLEEGNRELLGLKTLILDGGTITSFPKMPLLSTILLRNCTLTDRAFHQLMDWDLENLEIELSSERLDVFLSNVSTLRHLSIKGGKSWKQFLYSEQLYGLERLCVEGFLEDEEHLCNANGLFALKHLRCSLKTSAADFMHKHAMAELCSLDLRGTVLDQGFELSLPVKSLRLDAAYERDWADLKQALLPFEFAKIFHDEPLYDIRRFKSWRAYVYDFITSEEAQSAS